MMRSRAASSRCRICRPSTFDLNQNALQGVSALCSGERLALILADGDQLNHSTPTGAVVQNSSSSSSETPSNTLAFAAGPTAESGVVSERESSSHG
jgi:hypothetical protein